jgi:mono/diheme cytochrome c family protein
MVTIALDSVSISSVALRLKARTRLHFTDLYEGAAATFIAALLRRMGIMRSFRRTIIVQSKVCYRRWVLAGCGLCSLIVGAVVFLAAGQNEAKAGAGLFHRGCRNGEVCDDCQNPGDIGGTWYWMRSPEEEKRIIAGYYNRYCVRCHGVDGRGVWDMPCIPDFASARWQATRSDAQLARIIIEGRGAVMPPFRGTLTLEEACAMARYLRTFVPGTEMPKPDLKQPEAAAPRKLEAATH